MVFPIATIYGDIYPLHNITVLIEVVPENLTGY